MPATSKQSLIVAGKPSRGRDAARDARIRVARGAPGRCGILLHNRVHGRIKALDRGKSRTKEVPRGKFPPKQRRVQIGSGIE